MKFKLNNIFLLLLAILFINSSCTKKISAQHSTAFHYKSPDGRPVYSDLNYWAAHPWKPNPSDSIPAPLRKQTVKDSSADAFFIYPTSFTNKNDSRWNAPIDDSEINDKTDQSSILYQSSVLNEKCRIFSPRYRQANLKAFYSTETLKTSAAFDTAYTDVRNAFIYYLQHWNNGRPIIIMSHSQGTVHAAKLIKEFFEGKDLQNKLICAYIIGMPVPVDYFTKIPACHDSLSTGCIISWRTFEKGYTDTSFVSKETFSAIVTNPLTWRTDTAYAAASLNTGAVLLKFNKLKKELVDAQVHDNVLWASKPKFFGSFFLKTKNYHIGDINLYYNNIRQNIRDRIYMYSLK